MADDPKVDTDKAAETAQKNADDVAQRSKGNTPDPMLDTLSGVAADVPRVPQAPEGTPPAPPSDPVVVPGINTAEPNDDPNKGRQPILAPHATVDNLSVNEPTSSAPNSAEILTPFQTAGKTEMLAPDREAVREITDAQIETTKAGNVQQTGRPLDNLDEAQRVRNDAPFDDPAVKTAATEVGGNPDSRILGVPPETRTAQAIEQPRPNLGPGTAPVLQTGEVLAPHAVSDDVTVNDPPAVIGMNDPLGRQAGDPNSPIDLPGSAFGVVPRNLNAPVFSGDAPMSVDDMERVMAGSVQPPQRPDVVTDAVRQPLDLSDKTREEMGLGARAVAEARQGAMTPARMDNGEPVPRPFDADKTMPADIFTSNRDDMSRDPGSRYAQAPTITSTTQMEMATGAAAVARKRADVATGREIMARHAARRLADGAPADPGDLSYTIPKG